MERVILYSNLKGHHHAGCRKLNKLSLSVRVCICNHSLVVHLSALQATYQLQHFFYNALVLTLHQTETLHPITTPASASREVLWRNYHQFRCSQNFHTKCKIFLQSAIHSESTLILYQYITEKVFEDILKESFLLLDYFRCL